MSYLERVTECEHGLTVGHYVSNVSEREFLRPNPKCSAGSRVRIEPDYESAARLYLDDDMHGNLDLILSVTTRMVDTALGIDMEDTK